MTKLERVKRAILANREKLTGSENAVSASKLAEELGTTQSLIRRASKSLQEKDLIAFISWEKGFYFAKDKADKKPCVDMLKRQIRQWEELLALRSHIQVGNRKQTCS